MAIATVILSASGVEVAFAAQEAEDEEGVESQTGAETQPPTGSEAAEETEEAPNPILPVGKEIAWGLGSFLVLFLLMRYLLFPKVRQGMAARSDRIASDLAEAERVRAQAEAEVAEYQAQVAAIRAEGQVRVDAARAQLDRERQARLAEVNARLAGLREQSAAEVEAAKQAAMRQVVDAVADVAGTAAARVLGRPVDPVAVRRSVDEVVQAGVAG